MATRRLVVLLAAVLALVAAVALVLAVRWGADGEEDGAIMGDLAQLVLQPSDLPSGFTRFDFGRQVRADQPSGERADPSRFGRRDGWKARYRRRGSPSTRGPLVIESRVDVFESDDGAGEELETHRTAQTNAEGSRLLAEPDVGEEAFAATILQGSAGSGVRFYLIAWRDRNLTASVFVNGFDGKLSLADALVLAHRQQERIQG